MKALELFETDPLADLEKVLQFRATPSAVSQESAEKCMRILKNNGYRWKFEQREDGGLLHIVSSSFKKGWRNAPGRRERLDLKKALTDLGYKTAVYRAAALRRQSDSYFGADIYFW